MWFVSGLAIGGIFNAQTQSVSSKTVLSNKTLKIKIEIKFVFESINRLKHKIKTFVNKYNKINVFISRLSDSIGYH